MWEQIQGVCLLKLKRTSHVCRFEAHLTGERREEAVWSQLTCLQGGEDKGSQVWWYPTKGSHWLDYAANFINGDGLTSSADNANGLFGQRSEPQYSSICRFPFCPDHQVLWNV